MWGVREPLSRWCLREKRKWFDKQSTNHRHLPIGPVGGTIWAARLGWMLPKLRRFNLACGSPDWFKQAWVPCMGTVRVSAGWNESAQRRAAVSCLPQPRECHVQGMPACAEATHHCPGASTCSSPQKQLLRDVFIRYCGWGDSQNFMFISRQQFIRFARDMGMCTAGVEEVDALGLSGLFDKVRGQRAHR